MAKTKKQKRNIKVNNTTATMVIKVDQHKHKMTAEELENHLHLIKTGHRAHNDKSKYTRKAKHRGRMDY